MTPRQLGFRMPAEWEPHEATWIAWPHNREDWPGRFAPIPWVYGEIVRKLSRVERVRILVRDEAAERSARRLLRKVGAQLDTVDFFAIPTNRVWMRDTAPIFVRNAAGEVAVTNWLFNGWAKYDDWHLDNEVPLRVAGAIGMREWSPKMVLEGGSIDVNGAGLLLTTEECLLSPVQARNPTLTRERIEATLSDYLGTDRVLWLKNGIAGDDTHGHIDDVARFVNVNTVVLVEQDDDSNFERLRDHGMNVAMLPMPSPLQFDGQLLPASYANFYVANGTVLVPTFNDANDRRALSVLTELFPGREVVGINCTELILGLGALHCMTQQQPTHHRL